MANTDQFERVYSLDITSVDGVQRSISGLKIVFDVTKTILSFPNLAKIDLYNANETTVALLQKKYTKVTLNAGYKGNVKLLFKGEIRNAFQSRNPTDRITTVYAGDGQRDWENTSFNRTYAQSVTIEQTVVDIMKSFQGLTIAQGATDVLPKTSDKLRGQMLSGASAALMDDLAKEYGFDWSIQDGEIVLTTDQNPIVGDAATVINAATGMINSPTITVVGANVTTLLNPDLVPNRAFQITSVGADVQFGNLFFKTIPRTSAEGTYKIQEVNFKGDSRHGDWLCTVKGRTINVN